MEESGGPPPEAVRRGVSGGMFAATVIVVAIIAFVAGLGLGGVIFPQQPAGPQIPAVLVIGTNTPFPPFEFRDENDDIVGFDIDLITTIMERLGQDYELFDFRDFGALLAAVQTGRVDLAASAITSSGTTGAERNATMDFSDSYYEADQTVLIRVGDDRIVCADDVCTATDVQPFRIATQSGTTSEFWVADFVENADLTTFPDVTQVLQALESGSVDLVVIDKPAGEAIVAANPTTFDVAGTIETNELYAFAVPDGDPFGILPLINQELAEMRADGTYDAIVAAWFG